MSFAHLIAAERADALFCGLVQFTPPARDVSAGMNAFRDYSVKGSDESARSFVQPDAPHPAKRHQDAGEWPMIGVPSRL
jgi:hypothetical protein